MFHSQNIQVFVFLTILWFTKSVTSWWVWWVLVHEKGCIFEYIFWTTTYKVTKLGKLRRTEAKFKDLFNLSTCSNYSVTYYVKILLFHFFKKGEQGKIKNGNCQLLKMTRSCYINILVTERGLELVSSLHQWTKNMLGMFVMFVMQHISIWPNFILIALRIQRN